MYIYIWDAQALSLLYCEGDIYIHAYVASVKGVRLTKKKGGIGPANQVGPEYSARREITCQSQQENDYICLHSNPHIYYEARFYEINFFIHSTARFITFDCENRRKIFIMCIIMDCALCVEYDVTYL